MVGDALLRGLVALVDMYALHGAAEVDGSGGAFVEGCTADGVVEDEDAGCSRAGSEC